MCRKCKALQVFKNTCTCGLLCSVFNFCLPNLPCGVGLGFVTYRHISGLGFEFRVFITARRLEACS